MARRHQINLTLDEIEMQNISEYCRVHGMSPQGLFKTGAKRLILEDILERHADLLTIQSWNEVNQGQSEPIDDLLRMLEDDVRNAAGDNVTVPAANEP